MSSTLSTLGVVHTLISLLPVAVGAACFLAAGGINPRARFGQLYNWTLAASVVTSFGLSSTGGFNQGHALGLLALAAVMVGSRLSRVQPTTATREYGTTFLLTFSYFLLWIPGLNETLSRLPVSHPLGNGPDSAPVQLALVLAAGVFILGLGYQFFRLHFRRKWQHAQG